MPKIPTEAECSQAIKSAQDRSKLGLKAMMKADDSKRGFLLLERAADRSKVLLVNPAPKKLLIAEADQLLGKTIREKEFGKKPKFLAGFITSKLGESPKDSQVLVVVNRKDTLQGKAKLLLEVIRPLYPHIKKVDQILLKEELDAAEAPSTEDGSPPEEPEDEAPAVSADAARATLQALLDQLNSNLGTLQQVLRADGRPELLHVADKGLNGVMTSFMTPLRASMLDGDLQKLKVAHKSLQAFLATDKGAVLSEVIGIGLLAEPILTYRNTLRA